MKSKPGFIRLSNRVRTLFLLCSLAAFPCILRAHSEGETKKSDSRLWFEENKNQWPAQVLYQVQVKGGQVFLEKGTFTYLLTDCGDMEGYKHGKVDKLIVRNHAYKVHFLNSNPSVYASASSPAPFVRNYYRGNDPSKWASGVKAYENVSYSQLYSNIDLNMYSAEEGLKYDFVLQPGSKVEDIKLGYEGADKLSIRSGNLNIETSLGTVTEQKPYAYQMVDGKKVEIRCTYMLSGNTLGFFAGNYDKSLPLIIDPALIFSTYSGSLGDNFGFTATYDGSGNGYIGGNIYALGGSYPTTVGAFQNAFQGGGFDIALSKYNAAGTALLFATYYGGVTGKDQPHSLIVNNIGELVVFGRTNSTDFPTTAGCYDNSANGGFDIIVGKFNTASGALLGSTYLGGSGDDGVNIDPNASIFPVGRILKFNYADDGRGEVMTDNANNIYVTASTQSGDFPVTAGVVDNTLGGTQDACVFKLNSALTNLVWSTYLGGSGDDAGYGIKIDVAGNACVTGGTTSPDFTTTPGVIFPAAPGGDADGFVTILNPGATARVASTYIGTNDYDQSYFLEIDNVGDIYITGQTKGAYPNSPGVYSNPNSGQFIHKMNNTLTATAFSLTFGQGAPIPNISPTAFLVDSCQNIYVSGWTRCSTGGQPNPNPSSTMPLTANAYQSATDGCDFYFIVLTSDAKSLWYATYFGENNTQDHVDGGTSRFDRKGIIYQSVCASCTGADLFPVGPGVVWSNLNPSPRCSNVLIKFDAKVQPVAKANPAGPTLGCAPLSVSFNSTGSVGVGFTWDFGNGVTATTPTATVTYTTAGTYTVSLIVVDSLSYCAFYDTAYIVVTVGAPPILNTTQTNLLCFGDNNGIASVISSGGLSPHTYLWSNGQSTTTATGLVAGTYTVVVADSVACSSTTTVTITQPPPLATTYTTTPETCGNSNGTATINPSGGTPVYTYAWNNGQTTQTATGLAQASYTVTVTDSAGCTFVTIVPVIGTNPLTVNLASANTLCDTAIGTASAVPAGGTAPYTFTWNNNQTAATATGLNVGTYTVNIIDASGCTKTGTVTVGLTDNLVAATVGDTICAGFSATLNASPTGGNNTYQWLPPNSTTPSIIVSPVVTTTYSLVVTKGQCVDTTDCIVVVNPLPIAAVNPSAPCLGVSVSLTDGSVAPPGGSINSWSWSMPGGTPASSTSQNTSTVYSVAGPYIVTLTVTTTAGCTDTVAQQVVIYNNPIANFSDTASGCTPLCNIFTDLSNAVDGSIISWEWSFPGGMPSSSTLAAPGNVCYLTPGTYGVTLAVTTSYGCKDTLTIDPMINAFPLPKADFCVVPAQASATEPVFNFCDLWTPVVDVVKWYWDFGDGSPLDSINTDPIHSYTASVPFNDFYTYNVCLRVQNKFGCWDTICHTVEILPEFTFYMPNTFTPNSDNKNELFFGKGRGIKEYDIWLFDRWGNMIWDCHQSGRSTDWDTQGLDGMSSYCKWNGTVQKGGGDMSGGSKQLVQEDVYVWKVKLIDIFDKRHTYVGHVSVVR